MNINLPNRWVWDSPAKSRQSLSMSASWILLIACASNALLAWVSLDNDTYEVVVSVISALCVIGTATKLFTGRPTSFSEVAALVACGMWVAQIGEIWTSDFVSTAGKIRNGGFYVAFAMLSGLIYLTERVGRRTDTRQITTAVEVVRAVESVEGQEAHILLTPTPEETHIVVTPLDEGTIQAVIDDNSTPVGNGHG